MKHVIVVLLVLAAAGCKSPACEPGSTHEKMPGKMIENVVGGVDLSGTSSPLQARPSRDMRGKVDPEEAEVSTSTTDGVVITSIDKTPIRKVIDEHLTEIDSCYESEADDDSSPEAKIVVLFTISTKGDVSDAEIESSTASDYNIEACIVEHVKKWTFPPPVNGVAVPVRYPFLENKSD